MNKPRFPIDITGAVSALEAHPILTAMSDEGCHHEQEGLRLPLGIYNISISRVSDKLIRLCRRVETYFNMPNTGDPEGDTRDVLLEIIDYVELSLYAAAEHVDDVKSICSGFFKHTSIRDKNQAYKALDKAVKQHKHFVASAANAIKHQQSRIRLATLEFKDEAHVGALHGFFIEGVADGVVGPSSTFHRSKKLFSLTSLAWEIVLFLLLVSRDLATFLRSVCVQREGPVRVASEQFAMAVVAAARLPIYDFGEAHPFSKATIQLNSPEPSLHLLASSLYGSIRSGWSMSSIPTFGQLKSQYEGDGKTTQFQLFQPESVSFQRWT
ncbi:hypothetical protein [Pseudomonas sp. NFACC13-1]|uniref:hypothetical protein n=1 Tax=Pseudomonas sp. NFACC13-1 TaxID=1566245 RepID=UPI00088B415E|nr:hypothetical protein [Pseudomonas sp. NFACC13-1]SDB02174.1 hypothetical protein SAMN03159290_00034 [Pseudomonas sp. NFACC13-1]